MLRRTAPPDTAVVHTLDCDWASTYQIRRAGKWSKEQVGLLEKLVLKLNNMNYFALVSITVPPHSRTPAGYHLSLARHSK